MVTVGMVGRRAGEAVSLHLVVILCSREEDGVDTVAS